MKRVLVIFLVSVGMTQVAFAKKSRRDGFNFGTSVYLNGGSEPGITEQDGGQGQTLHRSEQRFKPHVGYVFGRTFNLGLGLDLEQETRQSQVEGIEADERLSIDETKELNGGYIFGRLLFGQIFFIQAGFGYYQREISKEASVEVMSAEGYFSGRREEWSVKAGGPGLHSAIGLEIPITVGFYVASQYEVRRLVMKKITTSGNLSNYNGDELAKQYNFGISYYFR